MPGSGKTTSQMLPNDLLPDTAEAFGVHTQKRGNVLHRHMADNLWLPGHQLQIPLLGAEGGQVSGAVFVISQRLLKHLNAEIPESTALVNEVVQPFFGYAQQLAGCYTFQGIAGNGLINKMGIRSNKSGRTVDVRGYFVALIIIMIQAHKARHHKIQMPRYFALLFQNGISGIRHGLKVLQAQLPVGVCKPHLCHNYVNQLLVHGTKINISRTSKADACVFLMGGFINKHLFQI